MFLCIFLHTHFHLRHFLSDGQASIDEMLLTWNWSSRRVILEEHRPGTFYSLDENFSKCLLGGTFAFKQLLYPWWPWRFKTLQRKKVWRIFSPFSRWENRDWGRWRDLLVVTGAESPSWVFWIATPCHFHFTVLPPGFFRSWPHALLHLQTL